MHNIFLLFFKIISQTKFLGIYFLCIPFWSAQNKVGKSILRESELPQEAYKLGEEGMLPIGSSHPNSQQLPHQAHQFLSDKSQDMKFKVIWD